MRALLRTDPLGVATIVIAVCAIGAAALASRSAPVSETNARSATSAGSEDLARCRRLGANGGADARCHEAWAESRRRFFGAETRP